MSLKLTSDLYFAESEIHYENKNQMVMSISAGIYLLKVNNSNTKTICEICLKLIIKTPEWRQ